MKIAAFLLLRLINLLAVLMSKLVNLLAWTIMHLPPGTTSWGLASQMPGERLRTPEKRVGGGISVSKGA